MWRSWPAKGQERKAHPHMEWGRQMAFINHFYFYVWDPDWGGAFIKTNGYVLLADVDLAQRSRLGQAPVRQGGHRLCGLRFGDQRVMAVMAATVGHSHLMAGFRNCQLTELVATLTDEPHTSRQATYDLRRLRRKGLIERLPHSQRYLLTPLGRRVAVLFTKAHGRVLTPGLAWLDPRLPDDIARRSPLAVAWRQLDRALEGFIGDQMVAA